MSASFPLIRTPPRKKSLRFLCEPHDSSGRMASSSFSSSKARELATNPFTSRRQSSPRPASPVNSPPATGSSTARPDSPPPPGGARAVIRRRAAADQKEKIANARPNSTRAAGAGGSSSTMLSMCDDDVYGSLDTCFPFERERKKSPA